MYQYTKRLRIPSSRVIAECNAGLVAESYPGNDFTGTFTGTWTPDSATRCKTCNLKLEAEVGIERIQCFLATLLHPSPTPAFMQLYRMTGYENTLKIRSKRTRRQARQNSVTTHKKESARTHLLVSCWHFAGTCFVKNDRKTEAMVGLQPQPEWMMQ